MGRSAHAARPAFFRADGPCTEPRLSLHRLLRQPGERRRNDGFEPGRSVRTPQCRQRSERHRYERLLRDSIRGKKPQSQTHHRMRPLPLRRHRSGAGTKRLRLIKPLAAQYPRCYRLHREELDAIEDNAERFDRLVELNVQEQAINVIKMASVQQRYAEEGLPVVHGWVFDVRTGLLKDLQIDFEAILSEIMQIYNITDQDWDLTRGRRKKP